MYVQSRSSAPPNPPIGGRHTAQKLAPNCQEPKVASIQKQNFALRIALNEIFCAQILYFSIEILRYRFLLNSA